MAARPYDLRIEQGADYEVVVPVLDKSDQPIDVTGWSARGQIRRTVTDKDVAYELTEGLSLDDGRLMLSIPAAVSSEWDWRYGIYDVELVSPDSTVTRFLTGYVYVSREVTR